MGESDNGELLYLSNLCYQIYLRLKVRALEEKILSKQPVPPIMRQATPVQSGANSEQIQNLEDRLAQLELNQGKGTTQRTEGGSSIEKYEIQQLKQKNVELTKQVERLSNEIERMKMHKTPGGAGQQQNTEQVQQLSEEVKALKAEMAVEKQKNEKLRLELMGQVHGQKAKPIEAFLMDSTIARDVGGRKFLSSLIPCESSIESILLYRASRDGWGSHHFHQRCDDQGATLVVFKTSFGKLCGGFTSVDWESSNKWKEDTTAFLFSLDTNTAYPIRDTSKTIFCSAGYGPYFGNSDLGIHGEPMNAKDNGYCRSFKNFMVIEDHQGKSDLTGTVNKFTCTEIEVFRVIMH